MLVKQAYGVSGKVEKITLNLNSDKQLVCDNFINPIDWSYFRFSLARIKDRVALEKKDPFINRLHCYWTLKRRSRNGAPLLRSMRYSMTHLARQRIQVNW